MPNLSDLLNEAKKRINEDEIPQGTATAPQGTATAPQGTATAPQGMATAPQTPEASQNTNIAQNAMTALGMVIAKGSEGTLYLQSDNKVLKVYHPGFHYNKKILPLVKSLNNGKGGVVKVYDYGIGTFDGEKREYEIMDYYPLGPASSRKDLKGNAEAILQIAMNIAFALDQCHKAGFIHKDVKPANILLVQDKPFFGCVLCDFGIAEMLENGMVTTTQSRTPIYAAPETYRTIDLGKTLCELTPAADFYSLGMSILSLWMGESAFRMKETTMAIQKVHDGIEVPKEMPEPLRTITQGLLVTEPENRWGFEQLLAKKRGENVQIRKSLKIVYNAERKQTAHSIEELAEFMVQDFDFAQRCIYTDLLSEWMKPFPEVQVQIKEIVMNTRKTRELGCLQIIHTLNPLYDLNLHLPVKAGDLDYAMYDKGIGRLLNNVYYLYHTKYGRDYSAMVKGWDADDAKLVHSPLVAWMIAKSFEVDSDQNYFAWFLNEKNKRTSDKKLTGLLNTFKIVMESGKEKDALGPKDDEYRYQVRMMQTICGYNVKPAYRLDRTDTVLLTMDDFYNAPQKKLKDALSGDKGIRGWLAVMNHENPKELSDKRFNKKRYMTLLEQYVKAIGHCNPQDRVYDRFSTAQQEAKDITSNAKTKIRTLYTVSTIQKLLTTILAVIPAVLLLVSIILNALDNPILDMNAIENKWVYYSLGALFAVVSYFVFFDGDGGCLISIIIGAVASALIVVLIKFLGQYLLWIYAFVVFAVILTFTIMTILHRSKFSMKAKSLMNPGFTELTIDPLIFAFSNEPYFHSVNQGLDQNTYDSWKTDIKNRWKMVIVYILVVWVLVACSSMLPKSSRMTHFNRQVKRSASTLFTNDTITMEEDFEVESVDENTPFVKPKQRGIIRE